MSAQLSNNEKAKAEEKQGKAAYKRKDYDAAIAHYTEAFALNPREVSYPHLIARVKFEQKEYEDCIEFCKRAVKVGKENKGDVKVVAKAYVLQGRARIETGEPDRGKADIEKAATFLIRIANVKYENKKYEESLKFCQRALNIGMENEVTLGLMVTCTALRFRAIGHRGVAEYPAYSPKMKLADVLTMCHDLYNLKAKESDQYSACLWYLRKCFIDPRLNTPGGNELQEALKLQVGMVRIASGFLTKPDIVLSKKLF